MPFDSHGLPFNCLRGNCTIQCDVCKPTISYYAWQPDLQFFCACGMGFENRRGLSAHCRYDPRHYPRDKSPEPKPIEEPVWWTDLVPSQDIAGRHIVNIFIHGYLGTPNPTPGGTRMIKNPNYTKPCIMTPRTFGEVGYGRLSKDNRLFCLQREGKYKDKWLYFPVGRPPFPREGWPEAKAP